MASGVQKVDHDEKHPPITAMNQRLLDKDASGTNGQEHHEKEEDPPKPFYGDLVVAVAFTSIVPLYAPKAFAACFEEPGVCPNAVLFVAFSALLGGLSWLAYLQNSNALSFAAFLSGLWLCAFENATEWPYVGECVITPQFQGLLVGCLSDGGLTFANQMVRFALLFGVGSYVSITNPHSVYHHDVLPFLGIPIVLSAVYLAAREFNWEIVKKINWNVLTVQGARWVLVGIFFYQTALQIRELVSNEIKAKDTLATIVKASFVACVGVVATGTFQNEIDLNERLEVLVRNRTREIQEKNDRLNMVELALKASETAIAITDSKMRIIWLNAACEQIASPESSAAECQGKEGLPHSFSNQSLFGSSIVKALDVETTEDEEKLTKAFSSSRKEGEICIRKMIYHLEVSPYEYSFPSGNAHKINKSGRFLVVLKNITAERAREVAEETAREEAMLAKAMGDSMVTLTHELRTPMQGIMGVTDMLLQQYKPKEKSDKVLIESLKLIMASSGLLLNLINNLLDVKKVDSEMMDEFPLSPVLARSAIQDTIDFCRPLASISSVTVVGDYGEDKKHPYQVVSNGLRLQQILINLVSNAIKYTSERSQICISIKPTIKADVELKMEQALASSRDSSADNDDAQLKKLSSNCPVLCFSISDSGPGIAPHQADRLFRRFARLDRQPTRALGGSTKSGQPSGTGLGLNLCQLFVQRMNGEIWATNNSDGIGSTFSFYLPLATMGSVVSPVVVPVSKAQQSRSPKNAVVTTSMMRVLLVDDVLINRKVIGRMIKLVGVSDIVTVDSGQNALRELSENGPFDLVITDLQMPGMSGSELCEAIMSDKTSPDIRPPVVVGLTADTSVKVAETCKASGMSSVLYKPISVVEMREFFATKVTGLQPQVWCEDHENIAILSAQ